MAFCASKRLQICEKLYKYFNVYVFNEYPSYNLTVQNI
jgi:hypothetical protein